MYAAEEERIKYIATKDKEAMKQATDSIFTSGASLRKRWKHRFEITEKLVEPQPKRRISWHSEF